MAYPVLLLRAELTELLRDELGTYSYPDGTTAPAVMVVKDQQADLPPYRNPEGLELVLRQDPLPSPVEQFLEPDCRESWELFLQDWNGNGCSEAARRVCRAYPGADVSAGPQPARGGPRRSLRIVVRDPRLPVTP